MLTQSGSSARLLALPPASRPAEKSPAEALLDLLPTLALVSVAEAAAARRRNAADPLAPLIEDGRLTRVQAHRMQRNLGKVRPTCFACGRHSWFAQGDVTDRFTCKRCGKLVSLVAGTAGFDEALLPDPPARILDRIVERELSHSALLAPGLVAQLREGRSRALPRPRLLDQLAGAALVDGLRLTKLRTKADLLFTRLVADREALEQDHHLARALCRMGLASRTELTAALRVQLSEISHRRYVPLVRLLQQERVLTKHQVEQVLPQLVARKRPR